jgi:hypothetical protein
MRESGPLLFAAALAGNIAVPCMAGISTLLLRSREGSRA